AVWPSLHADEQHGGVVRRGHVSGYGYGPTLTSSVVALGLAWLRDNDDASAVCVVQGFSRSINVLNMPGTVVL
ncbi:MAG: hypothetical protein ACK5OC_19050, partial [Pirellula sp.]